MAEFASRRTVGSVSCYRAAVDDDAACSDIRSGHESHIVAAAAAVFLYGTTRIGGVAPGPLVFAGGATRLCCRAVKKEKLLFISQCVRVCVGAQITRRRGRSQ